MFLDKKTDFSNFSQFKSFVVTAAPAQRMRKTKWILIIMAFVLLALFLPWTQNIRARGNVSTLNPEQRPQEVNSLISARISTWFIQNGDFVKKGDTLLVLAETKDEYLDPELLKRTSEQLDAKSQSADFYRNKVNTSLEQITALEKGLDLKLSQLKIKLRQYTLQVQSDSMAMSAAAGQFKIASVQVQRQEELYKAGLKSLVELEARQQYFQDALAKKLALKTNTRIVRVSFSIFVLSFPLLRKSIQRKLLRLLEINMRLYRKPLQAMARLQNFEMYFLIMVCERVFIIL